MENIEIYTGNCENITIYTGNCENIKTYTGNWNNNKIYTGNGRLQRKCTSTYISICVYTPHSYLKMRGKYRTVWKNIGKYRKYRKHRKAQEYKETYGTH